MEAAVRRACPEYDAASFSRTQLRWRQLSTGELRANAKSLTDALFATPVPAGDRPMENGYRWVNVLLAAARVIALLSLEVVASTH
jgi:hypothetical protein